MLIFRLKPIFYLDLAHLLTIIPLILLLVYLFVLSIIQKTTDCSGFYTNCEIVLKQVSLTPHYHDGILKHFNLRLSEFNTSDYQLLLDRSTIVERSEIVNKIENNNKKIVVWNYDWVALDEYALFISYLATILFGSFSALTRKRGFVFISILLYLINIIQTVVIEASDDRGYIEHTVVRYSLIYTNNSTLTLICKSVILILLLAEFIELVAYFVILRIQVSKRKLEDATSAAATATTKQPTSAQSATATATTTTAKSDSKRSPIKQPIKEPAKKEV